MKNCLVIGGGIIGLCSAYYLVKAGHKVTIIDKTSMDSGASYVNAGYVTPSHFMPLAAPGIVKQGLKYMFDKNSPLFIKPSLQRDFIHWAWAFKKSCTSKNVTESMEIIKDTNLLSSALFSEIKKAEGFKFQLEKKGLLMLCKTESKLKEEIEIATVAYQQGLGAKEISLTELKKMEPNVSMDVKGAVYYDCDSHTTPQEFMTELKQWLVNHKVKIHDNESVTDLALSNSKIVSVTTEKQQFKPDEVVLAAGSWSQKLSKQLGINIPLQAGKGYRIDTRNKTQITIPHVLCEAKVAVTPMNGFTRFAGTMEIGGLNHSIDSKRVAAIAKASHSYYPDISITDTELKQAACGLRPISPDGKPYIGKSQKCNNLTIATGHAMMGWSLGPATGKLVSEIISDKKTSLEIQLFSPDRKF
ncbi:NAD(P)/FAD-dependent oxidoreductase [Patiriisocius sp. Uisw_017]|jgi:D-amino-acid dehydrogenase|uniref:NAD(P)/FAD-dependent oxidoreductase n=1 Tax=Patiriisocius sp. Uisw_017 TaxID=3230968 RepID=UPI0039EC0F6E